MGKKDRQGVSPRVVKKFLALAPKFSPEDRKLLIAALMASGSPAKKGDRHIAIIHSALQDELVLRGHRCHNLGLFKKSRFMWKPFEDGADVLWDYMLRYFKPKGRAEELRAVRKLIEVAVNRTPMLDHEERQVTVARSLARICTYMESAFPGWATSGMLANLFTFGNQNNTQ